MSLHISRILGYALIVVVGLGVPARPQANTVQPLFTYFPSQMICSDDSFVAMTPGVLPSELVIVRIGPQGIEPPQKIPLAYHDVYGIKCNYQRIELLVREERADNFSRLPFSIRETGIQKENAIPIAYSISQKGPLPSEIEDFHKVQLLPLGDWYASVPAYPRFNVMYELHFTRTQQRSAKALTTKLSVDLVDETLDRRVNKTVPLIRYDRIEYAD